MPDPSWPRFLWSLKDEVEFSAYALLFLHSLVRGAGPERILASLLLGMFVIDPIYHRVVGGSMFWYHADLGHVVIDTVVMAVTFAVALGANRVYPLWIAGAQIVAISGHLYRLTLEEINKFAYDAMTVTPSYIQLVALMVGIAFHTSRRRRLGSYPSWRRSSPPMPVDAARTSPGT
jgi:hypothetical protein